MPRGSSISITGEPEPLLFATGLEAILNVALDASTVPADLSTSSPTFGRRVLKAGTLLTKSKGVSPTGKDQYVRYTGTGQIEGVLALDAEFLDGTSNSDTARGMFFHSCVFNAAKIVDYSLYGNAAASTLKTCQFRTA